MVIASDTYNDIPSDLSAHNDSEGMPNGKGNRARDTYTDGVELPSNHTILLESLLNCLSQIEHYNLKVQSEITRFAADHRENRGDSPTRAEQRDNCMKGGGKKHTVHVAVLFAPWSAKVPKRCGRRRALVP